MTACQTDVLPVMFPGIVGMSEVAREGPRSTTFLATLHSQQVQTTYTELPLSSNSCHRSRDQQPMTHRWSMTPHYPLPNQQVRDTRDWFVVFLWSLWLPWASSRDSALLSVFQLIRIVGIHQLMLCRRTFSALKNKRPNWCRTLKILPRRSPVRPIRSNQP